MAEGHLPATPARPRRRGLSAEEHSARQDAARRASALETIAAAPTRDATLKIPPPVLKIVERKRGVTHKLPAGAYELARKVYYEQHGTMTQCALAVIASGLSESADPIVVGGRLRTWWARENWPKRTTRETFALRDAANDGGLFRSERLCIGEATGSGPAPRGKKCRQSALGDSEYCYHHDPRPEYVQARAAQAKVLAAARSVDMVDIRPFRRWLEAERRRLLSAAQAAGRAHPNQRGWGLLAAELNIDQSVIGRMMEGTHNGAAQRAGRRTEKIRATTIVRYLEPTAVTFADIYGFEAPAASVDQFAICPGCGERKNHQAQLCRDCHEAQGERCTYVNRAGVRCRKRTSHKSGVCYKCRQITEREHKPRTGRPTWITTPMLILAAGEYVENPNLAWVTRKMWAANAASVRDVFASRKSLTGGLLKQFAKRGGTSVAAAKALHDALVTQYGPVAWPTEPGVDLEEAGLVPFAPFGVWLAARVEELGSYSELARRINMNPDNISKWLRGVAPKTTVRRDTVDSALAAFGAGTTFADLYVPRETAEDPPRPPASAHACRYAHTTKEKGRTMFEKQPDDQAPSASSARAGAL